MPIGQLKIYNMEYLIVKNHKIGLHFEPQIGTNNRQFRCIGHRINEAMPQKWSNSKKEFCFHWIYTFKYLDTGETFELEFDYNDNFLKKL
jgi:hypothetical protein